MKQSDDYYVRAVATIVSGKWTLLILHNLQDSTIRFSEIQRALPKTKQKVLTDSLKKLERSGMITRTAYPVVPPQVEYQLTPLGSGLLEVTKPLFDWAQSNKENIKRAQKAYDRRAS
ncbi:MAG TPA: helix-turn-helix domain-containing protein [Verrucomicrobiae bacterium]|nr:helix-turn-helix domain-containing protein [Verrucomicrobiae bacterium]